MRTRSSLDYGDAQRIVHACGAHCSALRLLHLGSQKGSYWQCVFCRSLYESGPGSFCAYMYKNTCVCGSRQTESGKAEQVVEALKAEAEDAASGLQCVDSFCIDYFTCMYIQACLTQSNTPRNPNTSRALESLSLGWRGLPQEAFKVH